MSKQTEAMKLARENFATAKELCDKHSKLDRRIVYGNALITHFDAVCQALAEQPAQQEPVAWMYPDDYERMTTSETFCTVYSVEVGSATRGKSTVALYTSPPAQRTWVGLTANEVEEIFQKKLGYYPTIYAVEAKLKEKNSD